MDSCSDRDSVKMSLPSHQSFFSRYGYGAIGDYPELETSRRSARSERINKLLLEGWALVTYPVKVVVVVGLYVLTKLFNHVIQPVFQKLSELKNKCLSGIKGFFSGVRGFFSTKKEKEESLKQPLEELKLDDFSHSHLTSLDVDAMIPTSASRPRLPKGHDEIQQRAGGDDCSSLSPNPDSKHVIYNRPNFYVKWVRFFGKTTVIPPSCGDTAASAVELSRSCASSPSSSVTCYPK